MKTVLHRLCFLSVVIPVLLFLLSSCEKETVLTIDQNSLSFTDAGGLQSVALTANKPWSVKSDQSWCRVSPSRGEEAASSKISISCDANTTYDVRNCTVTFTCAELTKTVSISQATNNGLLVSQTSYELTKVAQQLEIQVQANVKFSVEVDNGCKEWVKYKTTKGLTTSTVVLEIAENRTYDGREGKVTIKQEGGNLSSTITIKQSQLDGLFITTPEYNLSNEQHTLTVEVSTNVEFEVIPGAEWVKFVQTKGLNTKQIILEVAENDTYDPRETKVNVKQKNGDLSGVITIKQDENYGILVTQSEYILSNEDQAIDVEVKYNVDFDVVIPDECKDWISVIGTKGLSSRTYTFSIAKNEAYDNRVGSITFKQKDGPASGTVCIKQKQLDHLSVEKEEYLVSSEAQTLGIKVEANIDYDVEIDELSNSWLSVEETKALSKSNVLIQIAKNDGNHRTGGVILKGNEEIVRVRIEQEGINPVIIYTTTDGLPVWPYSIEDSDKLEIISNSYENGVGQLVLCDTVTVLPGHAFYLCSTLTSVRIPNGITSIGNGGAFSGCHSLTSITIPESVLSIGGYTFYGCHSLTSITIPESVSSIGEATFLGCRSLTSITIPESVSSIGEHSFAHCYSLTSITIPESVSSIGKHSFGQCYSLTSITIPESVSSIGERTFELCSSLTSITIPESVSSIGERAFYYCSSLTSITIPESVSSIGRQTFSYCNSLTSITIPKSVSSIGGSAFYGCTSLARLVILATVPPSWDGYIFEGSSCDIFVPSGSVEAYKTAPGWSDYANRIFAISE